MNAIVCLVRVSQKCGAENMSWRRLNLIKSLHAWEARAQLTRRSQGVRQVVKIFAFLAICYSILPLCLNYAHAQSSEGLLGFWRTLFSRPGDVRPNATALQTSFGSSPQKVALGKSLFFERRLSGDGTRSCASCHNPDLGFTDGLATARGLNGRPLERNTPTLFNLALSKALNLDGSANSLENQAQGPIENENELGGNFELIISRLQTDPKIKQGFVAAFPSDPRISKNNILSALAAYERSLVSPVTRFDNWIDGNSDALSKEEKLGFRLFVGKGGCVACHMSWRFSEHDFHDIGLPTPNTKITKDNAGKRGVVAFKTPTLRGVTLTAPYMHNGSLKTLEDVVDHYAEGVVERRGLSGLLQRQVFFTKKEKKALVAFLKTL